MEIMKIERINTNNKFIFLLAVAIIINVFSHYFKNVLEMGNTYFFSYACWLIVVPISILISKFTIIVKRLFIFFVLIITLFIGAIIGESDFNSLAELHVAVILCIAFFLTFCIKSSIQVTVKNILFLMRILVVLGVIASLYALVTQSNYLRLSLLGENVSWNSWLYKSFFGQRNIFGGFCFTTTIGGCYLYFKTKNKLYLFCIVLFGIQILATNSRASLVGYVILIGLSIYFTRKNKVFFVIFLITTLFIGLYAFGGFKILFERFNHVTSGGTDSAVLRINMWIDCIQYLWKNTAMICGKGMNSISAFLLSFHGVGSSHNAYIDALFQGGIIYLAIIGYSVLCSYKEIKENKDDIFKNVFTATLIAYCVYCLFEAGMSLYSATYFSVTITILLIMLPRYYKGIL